ncbi:MAG TPA: biotin/lipoyl-binding protein, partial [Ilumatobacteraceae bacterium]
MSKRSTKAAAAAPRIGIASLFPSDLVDGKRARRARIRRRAGVTCTLAVVLAGAGFAVAKAQGKATAQYRTAVVSQRSVAEVLTGVGAIEPVSEASVAFPMAGTVKTVDIALGATVTAGEQLGTLDTTDLETALEQKEEAEAKAQLIVTKALAGESVASLVSQGGTGMSYISDGEATVSNLAF